MILHDIREMEWRSSYWMDAGLFSAMAFILVVPTGGASASVLLACSLAFLMFRNSRHFAGMHIGTRERWFIASMALYPVTVGLSFLLNARPISWNFLDNPSRFLLALFIYYAIRRSRITPVGLVTGSIVGATGAGVLAIFQWTALDMPRPGGFVNPIPFGDIAVLLIFMASIPISLPKPWRLLRFPGIGLGVAAVILAQARGAWVAIPFLAWLAMEWYPGRCYDIVKRCALVIIVGGPLSIAFLVLSKSTIVTSGSLHDPLSLIRIDSLVTRIETWEAAWTLLSEYPWTGVGVGQYAVEARMLLETSGLSPEQLLSATSHAHNDYLHLGATMGIVGIVSYLLPVILIYLVGRYLCYQECSTMGVMLKMFAVGQGIFSLTQTQLSHNISTTFFATTAVCLVALGFNDLRRIQPHARVPDEG